MKLSFLSIAATMLLFAACNSDNTTADNTATTDTTIANTNSVQAATVPNTAAKIEEEAEELEPLRPAASYTNIVVLETQEGIDAEYDADRGDYEDKSLVSPGDPMHDRVATYGAAHRRWLAPKGWTGHGLHAGNEGIGVHIYPAGGNDSTGPRIYYHIEPACQGCALANAVPYFANARKEYGDAIANKLPPGIKITKVSPHIVTYSLPIQNGLSSRGVVYYFTGEDGKYFSEMSITLPEEEVKLMDYFIKRQVTNYKAYKPF